MNVSWCVDPHSAVKQVRLRLVNRGHRTLHLRIAGIAEWMMGANRADRGTVHTALYRQRLPAAHDDDASSGGRRPRERRLTALLCTQRERAAGFGEGTAFFALAGDADEAEDWSCDRRELFDARGRLVLPDHLGQQQGSGLDPCAALTTRVTLPAGDTAERVFLLGYADNPDAARRLATTAAAVGAVQRLDQVRAPLGPAARRDHRAHARPVVRRAGQPLAAVPDGVVPAVGQGRLLSGRRRHRLS